jgi:hypothetical protein
VAGFRTRFWELLSEKEQREEKRYTNITAMAEQIGTSRVTLYKYADEQMTSVDANVIAGFLDFLGLESDEVGRFLVLEHDPQSNAQEARLVGATIAVSSD